MAIDFTYFQKSAAALSRVANDHNFADLFAEIADLLYDTLDAGGKVLFCGNGGSAADSQHLAGELVVRFRADRPAMAGIALTVDSSVLTAALNDYWAFSTSGSSKNILLACEAARRLGMKVIGFTGEKGGVMAGLCDLCFRAPSDITSHIQECHIAAGHMLCGVVEERWAKARL